tara:strand:+ start:135 stop:992 length:858 start_codon:yes stop_codon:yes gene_type:complete
MTKIVSWNVNGIRSSIICKSGKFNKEKVYKELTECNLKMLVDKYDPDIICFQETKCSKDIGKQFQFPQYPFKYWNESEGDGRRGSGYSGTSIWSKIEPEFVDNKFINCNIKFENNEGRFMIAKFEKFDLINVYVPNSGTNYKYRIAEWDKNILQILNEYLDSNKPLIYTGDLNVVSKAIDIWNPEILEAKGMTPKLHNGLLKDERENFNNLIERLKYVDVYRYLNKNGNDFSWWDQRTKGRERNKGRRIDYFLLFEKCIEMVNKCGVLTEIYGSDHCPIILEINN